MTEIDRQFNEQLRRGIDEERVKAGEEVGEPYGATELDCAAASVIGKGIMLTPFAERRAVLLRLVREFFDDGFFVLAKEDRHG